MSRYYVYVHRRVSDGSIFYVGKGTRNRLNSRASRSDEWHKIVKDCGFQAEICSPMMSDICALSYERAIIHSIGFDLLCNKTRGGNTGAKGYKHDRQKVNYRAQKCMKPVINSDGVIFPSLKEAAKNLRNNGHPKATEAHISSCCKGVRHVAFGLSWSMNITKVPKLIDAASKVNENRKKWIVASNDMKFDSVTSAAEWVRRCLGIKCGTSDISRCCKGTRKLCGGLTWRYLEENNNV